MLPFEEPRYLGLYAHTLRLCPYTGHPLLVSVTGPAALVSRFWVNATALPADAKKVRKAKGDDSGPISKLIDVRTLDKAKVAIPLDFSGNAEEEASREAARTAIRQRSWYYGVEIHRLQNKAASNVSFTATRPNSAYTEEVAQAKVAGKSDAWIEKWIRKTEDYQVRAKRPHAPRQTHTASLPH